MGLLVGSILLGSLLLHAVFALVLVPFKLALALAKGLFAAVFFVPVIAVAAAVLLGLVAVGVSVGFAAMILHLLF